MIMNTQEKNEPLPVHQQKIGLHFAINGLLWAFKYQINIKIHVGALVFVLFLGLVTNLHMTEWLFVMSAIFAVLITEILNTSIEQATDAISTKFNSTIGHSKDLAAGAVLLSALYASLVGIIIFLPKIL